MRLVFNAGIVYGLDFFAASLVGCGGEEIVDYYFLVDGENGVSLEWSVYFLT